MTAVIEAETAEDGVLLMRLNRPERLNAINQRWLDEFNALADRLMDDVETRVVVLTGAGRGFCAGADIVGGDLRSDLPAGPRDGGMYRAWLAQEAVGRTLTRLPALPQPVIAAVNGPAAGGGFALALSADVRIASTNAFFNVANAKIGLSAGDAGISWMLPRLIGLSRSFEYMLSGRRILADEAERVGLVSKVTSPEDLLPSAFAIAREIAANAPFGVRMTKQIVWENLETPSFSAALDRENRTQVMCTFTGDSEEAADAFREKRAPAFGKPRV